MSYTWAKFNLLSQFFYFLVLNQATTAASSSSYLSKGGTHTTISINEWSLIGYISTLIIFVHIGYFSFGYFVAFVPCLYILLINIFSPCIVGGRKIAFCIWGIFLDIFWSFFGQMCCFSNYKWTLVLLIGKKT